MRRIDCPCGWGSCAYGDQGKKCDAATQAKPEAPKPAKASEVQEAAQAKQEGGTS